ncbi:hypothetical protein [Streptomyces olivoreticuli]|uniref:hypothetical protein n=1 Tax=Streptomyces olivoreticuli TaxID=68246 RepID=UPI0013C369CB|nr:hypothetical protein [Streptomyces olivoreticuli]
MYGFTRKKAAVVVGVALAGTLMTSVPAQAADNQSSGTACAYFQKLSGGTLGNTSASARGGAAVTVTALGVLGESLACSNDPAARAFGEVAGAVFETIDTVWDGAQMGLHKGIAPNTYRGKVAKNITMKFYNNSLLSDYVEEASELEGVDWWSDAQFTWNTDWAKPPYLNPSFSEDQLSNVRKAHQYALHRKAIDETLPALKTEAAQKARGKGGVADKAVDSALDQLTSHKIAWKVVHDGVKPIDVIAQTIQSEIEKRETGLQKLKNEVDQLERQIAKDKQELGELKSMNEKIEQRIEELKTEQAKARQAKDRAKHSEITAKLAQVRYANMQSGRNAKISSIEERLSHAPDKLAELKKRLEQEQA